ncbi:hypothetical protein BBJ29_000456 [Phytophthora kernoviae]|uniref:Uncharacterized protein n=1 Tax=Phytophthora kernoviae TaxID=325452 RepID=A0A3F2RSD9_9STRA|nr:hypothetical protein BBJ29_000456 [Phytophthora kernoviae]RLN63312.1 hypothetical protein BBP00_00004227 [Phytophthora kernoviae]
MESRFDKDIDGLFSRFQKGVQLIKNDMRLFRGLLYMSVKDVNMNDQQGVVDELVAKLDGIFESNRDQNFLTEMYSGKLEINCSPPFGTVEYYQSMENDAAKMLREVVAPSEDMATGFTTGKAFLDCLRVVLAKISILDWTGMDKSTQNLLAADVKQKLPGILRTGCQVPRPLLAEAVIPSHLKEDVLIVGSREKLVIIWKEVCQKYPHFAAKWMTLNDLVALDSVEDETFDVGFDVTVLQNKKVGAIQKTLVRMLSTTALRITLAVVIANTLNAVMNPTHQEFHRALAVRGMKENVNVKKGNTPVGNRVLLLEHRTATTTALNLQVTPVITTAPSNCTFAA